MLKPLVITVAVPLRGLNDKDPRDTASFNLRYKVDTSHVSVFFLLIL